MLMNSLKLVAAFRWAVVPLLATLTIQQVHADIVHKNDTNPTGIPDLTQDISLTRTGLCSAASWGNAMWYFQNTVGKAKLFPHTDATKPEKKWDEDGRKIVDTLADFIYGSDDGKIKGSMGAIGVQKYIYSVRPGDLETKKVKDTKSGKEMDVETWSWTVKALGIPAKTKPQKIHDYFKTVNDTKNWYGNYVVKWHEKDAKPGEFMAQWGDDKKPVTNKAGETQYLAHELGFAGRDTDHKLGIVTNGWGINAGDPVSNKYYDKYAFEYVEAEGKVRFTDPALLNKIGGLQGRTADYAEVVQFQTLQSDSKGTLGGKQLKLDGVGASQHEFTFFYENDTDAPVGEVFAEVPVLPGVKLSPGMISMLDLPSQWVVEGWDPDADQRWIDLISRQDSTIFEGYEMLGLEFLAQGNLLMPGESILITFRIDASLLSPDATNVPLALGMWNLDGEMVVGVVPAPGVGATGLIAMAGLLRRRRR
jgi:hypothetical protein